MKKLFALLLCAALLCAVAIPGLASGGENGPAPNMSAGSGTAAFTYGDDGLTSDESLVQIEYAPDAVTGASKLSGIKITSRDNAAGGVEVTAADGYVKIGGEEDNFAVTTYFTDEELSFNTVIDLGEEESYVWGTDSSGGVGIAMRGKGELELENVYALNTGIGRYTVSLSSGTTIIKNCYFESVGCNAEYSDMPWFTAQLGSSRNLIACGTLNAYIYNSTTVSEGYGSWSTDTGGSSYNFYLYNGDAINYYGGYGTYADTGLTVNVFASRFDSAEYGAFCTNTGILNIGSSQDALNATDETFLSNLQGQELAEDTPSEIIGHQNAIVFHVVDTMHQADPDTGVKDSAVSTSWKTVPELNVTNSVLSTVDACNESANTYPVLQQAWLDHLKGSTVLFRGACGVANLTNTALESATGILIHSCVDLDESTIQILDDVATEDIPGCQVNSVDNTWSGDILNEDYQRPMYLNFVNTELSGTILTKDLANWNALYADYADLTYEIGDDGLYVNTADPTDTFSDYKAVDPTVIYSWLCAFDSYDAVRGTFLTMDESSVWNVTATSNLNGLTLAAGAVIHGEVTVDGVAVNVSAGGTWTGDIVVTPLADGE